MPPTPGLRDRKRLAAMRRIQETALDLMDEHGYQQVTVERIAAAAEVSPSSVYRYFGTKERIVLWDERDVRLLEVVQDELAVHPPVEAVRRAIARVMAGFFGRDEEVARRQTRYWAEEPALQAAVGAQTEAFAALVADALASAAGRRPDDLDVQVVASALVWSLVAAIRHWLAGGFVTPLERELERALAVVESGLRLEPARRPRRARRT